MLILGYNYKPPPKHTVNINTIMHSRRYKYASINQWWRRSPLSYPNVSSIQLYTVNAITHVNQLMVARFATEILHNDNDNIDNILFSVHLSQDSYIVIASLR